MGWSGIKNGALLPLAEAEFDALITIDQGFEYQQNLTERRIAILLLVAKSNQIEDLAPIVPAASDELWNGRIVKSSSSSGRSPFYKTERDNVTQTVKEDYALVTVKPGIVPGRYIAVVGGLDTSGCAGATEFLSSASGIAELSSRLSSLGAKKVDGQPRFFQALIKVDLENGLDVLAFHLVTVHPIHSDVPGEDSSRRDSQASGNR